MSTPLSLEKRKDLPLVSCSVLSHFYPKWERERETGKPFPKESPSSPSPLPSTLQWCWPERNLNNTFNAIEKEGKQYSAMGVPSISVALPLPSSAKTTLHTQRCKIVRVVNYQLWICELWLPHQPGKVDFKMHTDFPSHFDHSQFSTTAKISR